MMERLGKFALQGCYCSVRQGWTIARVLLGWSQHCALSPRHLHLHLHPPFDACIGQVCVPSNVFFTS